MVAVDCDNASNKGLCGRFGVQGFPTVKIFSAGKKGMPTDYQGARTAKAIIDTLTPMVPSKYVNQIGGKSKKAITMDAFKTLEVFYY